MELGGEAFAAPFFFNRGGGFYDMETPCDVPDTVFGLYLRHFFVLKKSRRKFDVVNLKGSLMPPSKMAC